jgi:hypothetical protein
MSNDRTHKIQSARKHAANLYIKGMTIEEADPDKCNQKTVSLAPQLVPNKRLKEVQGEKRPRNWK